MKKVENEDLSELFTKFLENDADFTAARHTECYDAKEKPNLGYDLGIPPTCEARRVAMEQFQSQLNTFMITTSVATAQKAVQLMEISAYSNIKEVRAEASTLLYAAEKISLSGNPENRASIITKFYMGLTNNLRHRRSHWDVLGKLEPIFCIGRSHKQSTVWCVQHISNLQLFALKCYKSTQNITDLQENLIKERQTLRSLSSPLLCQLIHTFKIKEEPHLFFYLTEYFHGGSLMDVILYFHPPNDSRYPDRPQHRTNPDVLVAKDRRTAEALDETIRFYMTEIFSGLHYLHSKHIIHRNLKPKNCLLNDHGHIKLSDIGELGSLHYFHQSAVLTDLTQRNKYRHYADHNDAVIHMKSVLESNEFESPWHSKLYLNEYIRQEFQREMFPLTASSGNVFYMPPEVYLSEKPTLPRCDFWSAGIILYMLYKGDNPFVAECLKLPVIPTLPRVVHVILSYKKISDLNPTKFRAFSTPAAASIYANCICDKSKRWGSKFGYNFEDIIMNNPFFSKYQTCVGSMHKLPAPFIPPQKIHRPFDDNDRSLWRTFSAAFNKNKFYEDRESKLLSRKVLRKRPLV